MLCGPSRVSPRVLSSWLCVSAHKKAPVEDRGCCMLMSGSSGRTPNQPRMCTCYAWSKDWSRHRIARTSRRSAVRPLEGDYLLLQTGGIQPLRADTLTMVPIFIRSRHAFDVALPKRRGDKIRAVVGPGSVDVGADTDVESLSFDVVILTHSQVESWAKVGANLSSTPNG